MTTKTRENERRDYGIIIILILLLGFICIILASGWALRFSSSWKLNTNMGSNLDPNSDFLTSRPVSFIEPVDPAILTQPAWIDLFLTPGISLATRTPMPAGTATLAPVKTNTPISTLPVTLTSTIAANPTNTLVYIPPASTKTPKPPPPPTNTPITSLIPADLQINKNDGVTTYAPGGALTYTVTVINNGPNAVIGAVIIDNKPAQITTWSWACAQTGGATGCTGVTGSSSDFAEAVNLPVGASVVYTVSVNISGTATGNLMNIANVAVPVGYTDPTSGNNSATDTDTFTSPSADLQITKTDNATEYAGGVSVQYIIVVSNAGPSSVTGATVTDTFSANLTGVTWTCAGSGSSSCTASGTGDINDAAVNLLVGASVTYTVNATAISLPNGSLVNTAIVNPVTASVSDPNSLNNSATDTDLLASPFPPQLTASGDGSILNMSSSSFLDLQLPSSLSSTSQVIYYPDPAGAPPALQMDAIILQIGDGQNWYTILNWGDNNPNANAMDGVIANPACTIPVPETDNCLIDTALLTNSPGITIQLSSFTGTYPYIRIISPSNPPDTANDGVSIDAIVIVP